MRIAVRRAGMRIPHRAFRHDTDLFFRDRATVIGEHGVATSVGYGDPGELLSRDAQRESQRVFLIPCDFCDVDRGGRGRGTNSPPEGRWSPRRASA